MRLGVLRPAYILNEYTGWNEFIPSIKLVDIVSLSPNLYMFIRNNDESAEPIEEGKFYQLLAHTIIAGNPIVRRLLYNILSHSSGNAHAFVAIDEVKKMLRSLIKEYWSTRIGLSKKSLRNVEEIQRISDEKYLINRFIKPLARINMWKLHESKKKLLISAMIRNFM